MYSSSGVTCCVVRRGHGAPGIGDKLMDLWGELGWKTANVKSSKIQVPAGGSHVLPAVSTHCVGDAFFAWCLKTETNACLCCQTSRTTNEQCWVQVKQHKSARQMS